MSSIKGLTHTSRLIDVLGHLKKRYNHRYIRKHTSHGDCDSPRVAGGPENRMVVGVQKVVKGHRRVEVIVIFDNLDGFITDNFVQQYLQYI